VVSPSIFIDGCEEKLESGERSGKLAGSTRERLPAYCFEGLWEGRFSREFRVYCFAPSKKRVGTTPKNRGNPCQK
jgi:hypothetical protein